MKYANRGQPSSITVQNTTGVARLSFFMFGREEGLRRVLRFFGIKPARADPPEEVPAGEPRIVSAVGIGRAVRPMAIDSLIGDGMKTLAKTGELDVLGRK